VIVESFNFDEHKLKFKEENFETSIKVGNYEGPISGTLKSNSALGKEKTLSVKLDKKNSNLWDSVFIQEIEPVKLELEDHYFVG